MKRAGLLSPFLAVLVAIAALVLLAQGASAQSGSCSATSPCPGTVNCCSQYGYCGTGSAYCGTGCINGPCTANQQCSATKPCASSSNCCSQYNYCGTTSAYCGTGCMNGPCTANQQCSATKPCASSSNCCSQYNYCGTTSAYCGTGCQNGPCTGSTPSPPPPASGGSGWSSILTQTTFNQLFPNRLALYSYANLQTAAQPYPAFGTSGSSDDQKREVAAFLANVNQESGGLQYVEEIDQSYNYCDSTNTQYPCAPGKSYFGRGALQISWNYNYGACGAALNQPLLANPDLVEQNGVLAWQTACWFWITSNCHNAILQKSFSGTIRAINGGAECNQPVGSAGYKEMTNRVTYYKNYCSTFGVDPGTDLTC